jgi:hypothetical protein
MTIQELQHKIQQAKGIERLKLFDELLEMLHKENPQTMQNYLDEALHLAQSLNHNGLLAKIYCHQGLYYRT